MFFTKDHNSINENSGIKASLLSSEKSNIFDNQNTDSSFSLSGVNSFRSSDRSSYTSTEIDAFGGKNNYAKKSSHDGNATQAIAAAIQPDLIARTVSTPSSAAAGSTIQLSYEIENQGNASAGYSYTKFYLSQDLSLGSEDIFLGDDYVDNILSGYYRSESTTLTIGNSVAAGSYYLVYQADGYNYVAESNENNNAVADVINITKPDLIVQNTSNPSSAAAGSSIQLNYQIKNQGNASAVASNTKFYLSQDLNIGNEDVYLGYDYVSGIAAGSYSSESTTVNIGSNITAGNYYLAYIADGDGNVAESNETNNGIAGVITITPTQKSDLIVQNTSAPSTASVGSTIQLSYQIKNQGVGGAVATTTKFYLSKDNAFSNDDVLLGSDGVNAIAAGATSSETASLIVNNAIATGNYYLLYQADGAGNAVESNETNNFASKAIAITQADLIIQNAVSPSTTAVGSTIQLSYQVKNQGVGGAVATTTKFYISKDNAFSTDDVLLGSDGVNAIAAGATSSETASLIINNAIAAGNYYLLYKADANGNIGESNETNNIVSKAIAINGPKPDLIIQNISTPSLVDPGSLITVNYQLANQGTASADSSTTKFYLSKDTTLSSDDTYLSYSRSYFFSGLGAGKYSSESYSLILSSNITFGNYYLLLQADSNGEIFESNENNNVTAKAITIAAPDLLIQNPSAPASANIGTTIQLSYQVKNQGNGTAGVNTTRFYLSKDTSLSSEDISVGSDIIGISDIAPSAVISESSSLYLSSTITRGSYYLLYQADGFGSLRESNENNNVVAKAITITAPDLVIADASAPTNAAIGSKIEFTYKVKNQGNGNAGSSKGAFYLSRNTSFGDDDDISIGYDSVPITSLAVSAVVSRSVSWTIDTTIAAGKYYLFFEADGAGNVAESNESNNVVYLTTPINLTPINGGGFNSTTGYGLINAAAAVAKALGQSTFADVTDLGGDNWGADAIKAPEVWAKGYTGQGVIVAVIDSGVDYNHSDLSANIWKNTKEIAGNGKDDDGNGYIDDVKGWNFVSNNNNPLDDNGHGTHVAGTIAGVKNNFGVTGIAYNAKIMPVKVLNSDGQGSNSAIANGIRYAVNNGANVINLSLGGSPSSEIQSAIQYAASKGAITVMAAGNDGKSEPDYPARYATQWGLAVGAVFYNRTLTDFSHRSGTTPLAYVTAPGAYFEGDGDLGLGIYSTLPGNNYGVKDGTSMATPHVAGVIALMLSAKKGLTDAQVRQIVTTTAGNSLA
ncbi:MULTISPECIES: CARDB domain-containing protein [unclassified Nostoc]|uniref:CARDB domain-containing protein n=1 Tax=unclassified Nostoc TaxID=2593658 RepID=UPI002AD39C02|nr:CARDB domain-containing protein [Nostoc sp. DedQUE03]MDZ7972753.1 CARDB domain-containing protein [Nostoc sp. DedQUE03]MDZ8046116.1 CARDB domain-containing protein [Nostoc sp. DedQUE02]